MHASEISRPRPLLPLQGAGAAWTCGIVLALLMLTTRGHHFASIGILPSASWAVFFLAGLYLRRVRVFAGLFALSTALDFGVFGGTVDPWCVTASYWTLAPAYASLWFAGRLAARGCAPDLTGLARLALTLMVAALVAYGFSGGGFYFLSGHYAQASLGGFAERIVHYYPLRLGILAGYVGAALALHVLLHQLAARRAVRAA
mgnify:CR=1 FL=1